MKLFNRRRAKAKEAIDTLVTLADAARDQQNWREAIDAYKNALAEDSEQPGIWVQYAHALKEDGKIEDAVDAYRLAVDKMPEDAETHVHLAHVLKRLKRIDEAVAAFKQAIDLNPSDKESARELSALQASEAATEQPVQAPFRQADFREIEIASSNLVQMAALKAQYNEVLAENELLREQVQGQQEEMKRCQSTLGAFEIMASAERTLLEEERDAAIERAARLEKEVSGLGGQSGRSE